VKRGAELAVLRQGAGEGIAILANRNDAHKTAPAAALCRRRRAGIREIPMKANIAPLPPSRAKMRHIVGSVADNIPLR
jgi:hypothetical protein